MLLRTYFLSAIPLMVALHFALPLGTIVSWPWSLFGLGPILAGMVLNLLADRSFTQFGTTVRPFETSTVLVTRGVFRLSRNPMYLGMMLALAGMAMLLGSAGPWLVVLVMPVLFQSVFIRHEEQMLEERFGDQFREYRKRVRRWV